MKKPKLYNLVYIVSSKVLETIKTDEPYQNCNHEKTRLLKTGNYKSGLLSIQFSKFV